MRHVSRIHWVSTCLMALCSILFLGDPANAEVLRDDFNDNSIDPMLWNAYEYGTGPQIDETNQQLEVWMPGSSSGGDFGVKLASKFLLRGDFDVQVDFRLLTWPFGNGVRMALGTDRDGLLPHPGVERISFGQFDYEGYPREVYLTDFPDGVAGITGTDDMTGRLRLVRTGGTQTGYYYDSGWVFIHTGPAPTQDIGIMLATFSAYQFMGWDVRAAWDNLVVNSGDLVWPGVPTGACCLPGGGCVQEIAWECDRAGGVYMGDGVPCVPDPCGSTPAAAVSWGRVKSLFR